MFSKKKINEIIVPIVDITTTKKKYSIVKKLTPLQYYRIIPC